MLTNRQLDLLRLAEFTVKEQAKMLGIATGTVKNLRSGIYKQLGIRGPCGYRKWTKAIIVSLRRGFLTMSEIKKPPARYKEIGIWK